MSDNDSQAVPPGGDVETDALSVQPDAGEAAPLRTIDVEALTAALRQVQERMPDLVQLSLRERQRMANAANLDPLILDRGLDLAAAWPSMKQIFGESAEDLRGTLDQAARNEGLRQVLLAFADTLKATNLALKHRTGSTLLRLYAIVGASLRNAKPDEYTYVRPQYEQMKRAILHARKKRRANAGKDEEPDPAEE